MSQRESLDYRGGIQAPRIPVEEASRKRDAQSFFLGIQSIGEAGQQGTYESDLSKDPMISQSNGQPP